MREILFRGFHECENGKHKVFVNGKRIIGEWMYGYYSVLKTPSTGENKHVIFSFDRVVDYVIPETVGEYTGKNDRNGKRIFEGDIAKCAHDIFTSYSIGSAEGGDLEVGREYEGTLSGNGAVIYRDGCFTIDDNDFDFVLGLGVFEKDEIEIIGNIYEAQSYWR